MNEDSPLALTPEHQALIFKATQAIVERDYAVVRSMRNDDAESPHSCIDQWVYIDMTKTVLVMPPGDLDDWDIWGSDYVDGDDFVLFNITMWGKDGETDFTLQLEFNLEAGRWVPIIKSFHMM